MQAGFHPEPVDLEQMGLPYEAHPPTHPQGGAPCGVTPLTPWEDYKDGEGLSGRG